LERARRVEPGTEDESVERGHMRCVVGGRGRLRPFSNHSLVYRLPFSAAADAPTVTADLEELAALIRDARAVRLAIDRVRASGAKPSHAR
jgi:hypothetical protein